MWKFPEWKVIVSKISDAEKNLDQKITQFKKGYPISSKVLRATLGLLPPVLSDFALNLYDSLGEQEGAQAIKSATGIIQQIKMISELEEDHYNNSIEKLNSISDKIDKLGDEKQSSQKTSKEILDFMTSSGQKQEQQFRNLENKVDQILTKLETIGGEVSETRDEVKTMSNELHSLRNEVKEFAEQKNVSPVIDPTKQVVITKEEYAQFILLESKEKQLSDQLTKLNSSLPINAELVLRESAICYYAKDYDKALALVETILVFEPNNAYALTNKGISLDELGEHEKAIKCFDEAIRLKVDLLEAWSNKGVALGKLGDHYKAIKCFDEAIRLKPDDHKAWGSKGNVLFGIEKVHKAITCYDMVIRLKPDDHKAWYNKGNALGSIEEYDKAIKCFDEAIRLKPDDHKVWYNKGNALDNLGEHEKAIECYDEAIKIKEDLLEAWTNKGVNLGKLGEYDKAIVCFEEVLRIKPEDTNAQKAVELARKLKSEKE